MKTTVADMARSAAHGLAYWSADLIAPNGWSSRDYGRGYTQAHIRINRDLLRLLLPQFPKKFRREIGQRIREQLSQALQDNRKRAS